MSHDDAIRAARAELASATRDQQRALRDLRDEIARARALLQVCALRPEFAPGAPLSPFFEEWAAATFHGEELLRGHGRGAA